MNSLQFLSEQVDRVISRSSKASQRLGDGGEGVARSHSLVDMAKDSETSDSRKRPLIQRSQTMDAYTGMGPQDSGYDGIFRRPFEDIESLASTIRRIGSFVVGSGGEAPVAQAAEDPAPAQTSVSEKPLVATPGTVTPKNSGTPETAGLLTPFSDGEVSFSESEKKLSKKTSPKRDSPPTTEPPTSTIYYIITLSFIWDTLRFLYSPSDFLVRVFRNEPDERPRVSPATTAVSRHTPSRLTPETDIDIPSIREHQSPSSGALARRKNRKTKFRYPKSLLHPVRANSKTLILDLDETLIHSQSRGKPSMMGHMVEVRLDKRHATLYYVHKRPFCDDFLKLVCKWYNVVVFTASVQEYADPVIDWLEQEQRFFSKRYYRQHCTKVGNGYVKDLTCVDKDLSKLLIIDNSPVSYMMHENNAIAIEGWINDPTDVDLLCLLPVLNALRYCIDVRQAITLRLGDGAFE
ncbi:Nuclear envelope morphology protein 1 [Yarrowia sp. C11]|nr:Nuclear envelope morphology protein 1 [Yarrowia sp. E02]KAG5373459.1 Nuclear envelope morphology protein 1 [Yarrowia sp. C11]